MADLFRLGVVGLDSSHTIEFTRHFQGDVADEHRVGGFRVVKALRFPSAFQAEDGQDKRQAQLEAWDVTMVRTVEEVADGVDGLLVVINDPALHLAYFEQVAGLGLPVFLDKPLAGSLADGRAITGLADQHGTCFWSASSLRFIPGLQAARAVVPKPTFCSVFGALGRAPAGSDLVWYGVHAGEMAVAAMGAGATHVRAIEDPTGIVAAVRYGEERRAVIEYNRGAYLYGGRLQAGGEVATFDACGAAIYYHLLVVIGEFYRSREIPVPWTETLEVQAIHDAAERSLASGREEAVGARG